MNKQGIYAAACHSFPLLQDIVNEDLSGVLVSQGHVLCRVIGDLIIFLLCSIRGSRRQYLNSENASNCRIPGTGSEALTSGCR